MTTVWIPVPEPISWPLPKPQMSGGMHYATLTVGAPTSEDVLKATAIHGATGLDVTLRMVESASAEHVPYDVLKVQPHWFTQQVSDYIEGFAGAPAPDPLESWRVARRKALLAQAAAEALEAEALAKAQAALAAASVPAA
jgi:hypothetical protein